MAPGKQRRWARAGHLRRHPRPTMTPAPDAARDLCSRLPRDAARGSSRSVQPTRRSRLGSVPSVARSQNRLALELEREPCAGRAQLALHRGEGDADGVRALLKRQAAEVAMLKQLALPRAQL